ncbi:MAG: DUF512 domain-containing protein [Firmicutes bacterium]|nr:DUF512 domain-containing protein [Bacillota bacterium]
MDEGSIAERLGIEPGSRLIRVNGCVPRDVIDFMFQCAEPLVELEIEDPCGSPVSFRVEKHPDERIGLQFDSEVFDEVMRCRNACPFCFVDGLPPGMRRTLYLKDDDYRLSFLHGNFITMTNMTARDFDRIARQRLSPLYVSVHSTDERLRRMLLGVPEAGDIMGRLRLLTDSGIKVHAQVVVVPGINDGADLDSTVTDLSALWPGVASVGVVPVGTTRFSNRSVTPVGPGLRRRLVEWWRDRRRRLKRRLGYGFLFLADEVFLGAGEPLPPVEFYEDFPQYENGIGMAAAFSEELRRLRLPRFLGRSLRAAVVCGTLAAPLLEEAAGRLSGIEGLRVRVVPVPNRFFGESVSVSGLLTGCDIVLALRALDPGDLVVVPSCSLRDGSFLDGMTLDQMADTLGCGVVPAGPGPADLLRVLEEEGGRAA